LLAFLGTPDMKTVLVFSVFWQTVYFGKVNIFSYLLITNKLVLLYYYQLNA